MTLPDPDELNTFLVERVEALGVPAASAAFRIGADVVEAATGILNLRTGVEATTDSLFQAGSTTKLHTATLAMQLVGEGKVGLDDRIEDVLEGVQFGAAPEARGVTVRHLLAHTSGVHGDKYQGYGRGDGAVERFVADMGSLAQVHPLGAMHSYCNAGYSVLGRMVEVLTEMPFHAALTQRLLVPIGADHSAATAEEALMFRTAMGHVPNPEMEGEQMPAPRWDLDHSVEPAGALLSCSARDLTTFTQMHLDGGKAADGTQVVSADAIAEMQKPQVELPAGHSLQAVAWGLGWVIKDWGGATVIGHNGDTLGQHAFCWAIPEAGMSVALLTNGLGGHQLFDELVAHFLPKTIGVTPVSLPKPAADPSAIDIEPMLGTFSQPHADLEITRAGTGVALNLRVRPSGQPEQEHSLPTEIVDESILIIDAGAKQQIGFFGRDEQGRFEWLHFSARVLHRTA